MCGPGMAEVFCSSSIDRAAAVPAHWPAFPQLVGPQAAAAAGLSVAQERWAAYAEALHEAAEVGGIDLEKVLTDAVGALVEGGEQAQAYTTQVPAAVVGSLVELQAAAASDPGAITALRAGPADLALATIKAHRKRTGAHGAACKHAPHIRSLMLLQPRAARCPCQHGAPPDEPPGSAADAASCCLGCCACPVLSCLVLSCLVLSCLVLSCLVLSCLVLSCPSRAARRAAPTAFSLGQTIGDQNLTVQTPNKDCHKDCPSCTGACEPKEVSVTIPAATRVLMAWHTLAAGATGDYVAGCAATSGPDLLSKSVEAVAAQALAELVKRYAWTVNGTRVVGLATV
eukprot:SAG22_NODE_2319_length_2723_cov_11.996189_1_plen_342_part_00